MLRTLDPSNGRSLTDHPELEPAQVEAALERASRAFVQWRETPFSQRSACLESAASLLREEAAIHAETMALEMGKPLVQGRAEVEKCAWACEYYAQHGPELLAAEAVESDAVESWVQYEPLGPVLAIMPWNFPFWQVFRFAAPALLAGNVGLLKHASNVPRCGDAIEGLLLRAGFPEGAFQHLALSSERASQLVAHDAVRAVTLTGSEKAGTQVAAKAGRALKTIVLELGGSDPFIVLGDARVAQVAKQAARARTQNAGQSCIAAKRFIVDRSVEQSFVEALRVELEALQVGDPQHEDTDVGPLARGDLRDALQEQVAESIAAGARLVTGGKPLDRPGFFYPPTLLSDVQPGMRVADEETFGPVAAVISVNGEEEALRVANLSEYGLGASVWSGDRARAVGVAHRLEAGCVAVNGIVKSDPRLPFGGVKRSGFGRELGKHGLHAFVNVKSLWIGEPA